MPRRADPVRRLGRLARRAAGVRHAQPPPAPHPAAVEALEARVAALEGTDAHWRLAALESLDAGRRLVDVELLAGELALARDILATEAWIAQLDEQPLRVSVCMATRNRAELLPRAIGSVQAQTHPHWQLVVVDDGSEDRTPEVLAGFDDPRIVTVRSDGRGQGAALNVARDHADGDVIAYFDDDNIMLPEWLRAVAWTFGQHPEVRTAYGARVRDRDPSWERDVHPTILFEPWSRRELELRPIGETNTFVHRREGFDLSFDESLPTSADWDLIWRATEDHDPTPIPVRAILYTFHSAGRMSDEDHSTPFARRLLADRLRSRRVRVVTLDGIEVPGEAAGDPQLEVVRTPLVTLRQTAADADLVVLPADLAWRLLAVLGPLRRPFASLEPMPELDGQPTYLGTWTGREAILEPLDGWRALAGGHAAAG